MGVGQEAPVSWDAVEDIRVLDDDGTVLYAGPKYLRCARSDCLLLMTHGEVQNRGACWCGNRRLAVALRLKKSEQAQLKAGYYLLTPWERVLIAPELPAGKFIGWGHAEWEATVD